MSQTADKAAQNRLPRRLAAGLAALFLILYWPRLAGLGGKGMFSHLEDLWQDGLFRLKSSSVKPGDPRIVIIALDEDTGKRYGFPLPRNIHARLLDKLKEAGATTVAFDMMFLEPQPQDRLLVAATRRFGKVVHLFATRTQQLPQGDLVTLDMPVKGLPEASEHLGYPNIDLVIDDDGHVRRALMFDRRVSDPKRPDHPAPSMDIAAAASFLGKPLSEWEPVLGGQAPRPLIINFRKPKTWLVHPFRDSAKVGKVANLQEVVSPYLMVSALDLLDDTLGTDQKKALRGALIIIGSTSLGYFDHYPTPFTSQAPGVEYHANNIDNLMHGDYIRPVPRLAVLLAILAMVFLPLGLSKLSPAAGSAAFLGVFGGWMVLSAWAFGRGMRLDFVAPAAALFTSFVALTVERVVVEGREKRFIKNLFGQFVAPEVVEDLARDPGKVKLGGEKRDLTIFFLDIAHFTNISEKMDPEALIKFLNNYLSPLSKVVQDHKGVVDKYIGDCIMAFWNAPIELKDHRGHACVAAIECQETLMKLNEKLDPNLPEKPAIRIGLNSGVATVGLTGSEKKLQYTVIGDEVNLASRLEGANKFFGSRIMASEAALEGARELVDFRELGQVRVVGKAVPVRVFELLAKKGQLSAEWKKALPLYEKGVALFRKREFAEALAVFQEAAKIFPDDGPIKLYLNLATDYGAIPPDAGWDGVFNLTSK